MKQKTTIAIAVVIGLLVLGYFLLPLFFNPNKGGPLEEGFLNQNQPQNMMKLESLAFKEGDFIPSKYTCDEAASNGPYGFNPPLSISGVPLEAKSLVLIMDDPDVPKQLRPEGVFDHWVVYNIPAQNGSFNEGEVFGTTGLNGRGEAKYTGPCPPTEYQPTTHRYFFNLYAIDLPNLNFVKSPTKQEVLKAIEGHIVEATTLIGNYDRTKTAAENN